ncbi:MAG: PAS domain S-box protein [Alphaproteobacteria bacterium]|nr:PAS domain S-box protein [Alphaproteobacteria bacterium]
MTGGSPLDPGLAVTTLLDAVPIGAYLVDADFRIRAVNAAARPAFGEIRGGVVGRDFEEIIHVIWEKSFADDVVRIFRRVLESGETYVARDTEEMRADRRIAESYEWRVVRVAISEKQAGVVCFFREIGEQRRAEQAQRRLSSIVESSDDAIISKDLNGVIVSWNRGAERLFGYSAAHIVGKHISILIPEDRQDEEPGIIERIRRGERVDHYETMRRRKDGTLLDISLTVSPIRDAGGKVIGASKIARDISQRRQAETTRQLLINELDHRVKNTLASVQAIVQQTLRSTKDPADFAARLSGRIQSMARVHSLLTESTWAGADLRELIRDQLLQGPVDETKLTAWGPAVQLAAQTTLHLALMLHELGTNSIKHGALSATGGWVTVSWTVRDDTLHLQWEERGGPTVAAPVKRGFGMTLIEQSAQSEGGRAQMLVDAKGVTWQIELPLPPSRAKAPSVAGAELVSPAAGASEAAKPRPALAGRRLLVIEDEPLIALAIVATLESAGAEVARPAGNEKEALRAIGEGTFDGAMLDANLHGRSVGEIAAALTRRQIPFVFVTGYGRQALPDSFRHIPLVAKPFSDRELIEAAAALGGKGTEVVQLMG